MLSLVTLQSNILEIHSKGLDNVPDPDARLLTRLEIAQEALRLSTDTRQLLTRCIADIRCGQVEALGFQRCDSTQGFKLITGVDFTESAYDGSTTFGKWAVNPISGNNDLGFKLSTRRMWYQTFNTASIPFERRTVHLLRWMCFGALKQELVPPAVVERVTKLHDNKLFDGYAVLLPESMLETQPQGQADPIVFGLISFMNKSSQWDWTSYFVDSW